ncbi:hypothetical protein RHGRI_012948 [Rhododendron griersonianum]|uniref:Agglutinin domain-containing protein n=1 Tax=Rhododendron griersonianum TaxID=479676 RepID=A0AAV6K3Y8_9ERIC|nr:hypothetical protein RHGRI_012948 [Rhododendron griersonianum]
MHVLFKPVWANVGTGSTNTAVRFRHIKLQWYLKHTMISDPYPAYLYADPTSDRLDVFRIGNWEMLLILPKHVALKGDNGLNLSARLIDEHHQYLQFASSDNGDPTVGNEVFITKYDTTTDDSDTDTLFSPVKVGDNVIALRSMVNGSFCMRISEESKENCAKTNITAGIPFIVDGKIEISAELTAGLQWGETVTTENQVETEDTFTMPPILKQPPWEPMEVETCKLEDVRSKGELRGFDDEWFRIVDGLFESSTYGVSSHQNSQDC